MDLLTLLKIYLCIASLTHAITLWKSASKHLPQIHLRNKTDPKALPGTSVKEVHPPEG